MPFLVRDTALRATGALPNGAGSTFTGGIDLGNSPRGDFVADVEIQVEAPALTTGELPNGITMTYDVQDASLADFSDAAVVCAQAVQQTGAGGAGAAAQSRSVRLPTKVRRYIRVRVTNGGTGNASGKTAVLSVLA